MPGGFSLQGFQHMKRWRQVHLKSRIRGVFVPWEAGGAAGIHGKVLPGCRDSGRPVKALPEPGVPPALRRG